VAFTGVERFIADAVFTAAVEFIAAARSTGAVWCVGGWYTERPADITEATGSLAATIPIRHAGLDIMAAASMVAARSTAAVLPIVVALRIGAAASIAEVASTEVVAG
jgi:hypothetical protein